MSRETSLDRTNPCDRSSTTRWWVQEYGNFVQLCAYRSTGTERHLDTFRAGAGFWNRSAIDGTHGGTAVQSHVTGGIVRGTKAVRLKTPYHPFEHSLLLYLYVDLRLNRKSVSLHYQFETPRGDRHHPLLIEELSPDIERVWMNGITAPLAGTSTRTLWLPDGESVTLKIDVSSQ